jgi:hypothetical protein
MIFEAIKELGFDIDKRHYHTKIRFGSSHPKTVEFVSGFTYNELPFVCIKCPIIEPARSVVIRRSPLSRLIVDAVSNNRRIAILGDKHLQPTILAMLEKILTDMSLNYHRVGNDTAGDIAIGQHLKHLSGNDFYHPMTLICNLSGADDWYYLQEIPSGVIALLPYPAKTDVDRIISLQRLPADIFHTVVRSTIVPSSCPDCQPVMNSAVSYPALRRIATKRNELLHVHPIRINQACDHPKKYLQLFEEYTDGKLIGPSIIDQLYDMLLKHEIDWPAFEANNQP